MDRFRVFVWVGFFEEFISEEKNTPKNPPQLLSHEFPLKLMFAGLKYKAVVISTQCDLIC